MTTRGRPRWGGGSILNLTRGFARSKTVCRPVVAASSSVPLHRGHYYYTGASRVIVYQTPVGVCVCVGMCVIIGVQMCAARKTMVLHYSPRQYGVSVTSKSNPGEKIIIKMFRVKISFNSHYFLLMV